MFIKATDYFGYVERELTNPPERRENISELMRFSGEFETLPEFLEQITLLQATDQTARANREGAVHLMTMHLAKGLEFDRVFIAGATEGILPHARSLSSLSELEEERRLMYVAMTRARKELYISFYDLPSRFLSELPGNCTAFQSEVSDGDRFEDSDEKYITLD
jgi:DNA helicase-2/ATP-dependent DNA helicase PcrA